MVHIARATIATRTIFVQSTPTDNTSGDDDSNGPTSLPLGPALGGAVGGMFIAVLFMFLWVCFRRHRKKKRDEKWRATMLRARPVVRYKVSSRPSSSSSSAGMLSSSPLSQMDERQQSSVTIPRPALSPHRAFPATITRSESQDRPHNAPQQPQHHRSPGHRSELSNRAPTQSHEQHQPPPPSTVPHTFPAVARPYAPHRPSPLARAIEPSSSSSSSYLSDGSDSSTIRPSDVTSATSNPLPNPYDLPTLPPAATVRLVANRRSIDSDEYSDYSHSSMLAYADSDSSDELPPTAYRGDDLLEAYYRQSRAAVDFLPYQHHEEM